MIDDVTALSGWANFYVIVGSVGRRADRIAVRRHDPEIWLVTSTLPDGRNATVGNIPTFYGLAVYFKLLRASVGSPQAIRLFRADS